MKSLYQKKLLQVLSRIIGIILAALSMQFILDGLQEALKTFIKYFYR